MSWLKIAPGKSGARELATGLIILWVAYCVWLHGFVAVADVKTYEGYFEIITTAVFVVVTGAFGVPSVMNRLTGGSTPAPHVPLKGARKDPDHGVE